MKDSLKSLVLASMLVSCGGAGEEGVEAHEHSLDCIAVSTRALRSGEATPFGWPVGEIGSTLALTTTPLFHLLDGSEVVETSGSVRVTADVDSAVLVSLRKPDDRPVGCPPNEVQCLATVRLSTADGRLDEEFSAVLHAVPAGAFFVADLPVGPLRGSMRVEEPGKPAENWQFSISAGFTPHDSEGDIYAVYRVSPTEWAQWHMGAWSTAGDR